MPLSPRRSLAFFIGLGGLASVLSACGGGKTTAAPSEKPRSVRVVPATLRGLPRSVVAVGTLAAEQRADLSFKVPGRLRTLNVDIGSSAQAGAVLAELEKEDYALQLERARGALAQARARLGLPADGTSQVVEPENTAVVRQNRAKLEQARAELTRNGALLEQGLISHATHDVVEANFKVAESQYNDSLEEVNNRLGILAERRSSLAIAAQQLTDATLIAPFAGAIQERKANAGEYLIAGQAVLTLVKLNPIRLRLEVPEREARSIHAGQAVNVRAEGDTSVWQGAVARISPALQESNRTLVVEAEIPNPKGVLKPGQFVRAEIQTDGGGPTLVVPASSVVVFAGIEKVVTIQDEKAVERPVVTGRHAGPLIEIVSGLKEGELVVEKPGNLATGVRVALEDGTARTPARPTGTAAP